jgi:hypothetical protein
MKQMRKTKFVIVVLIAVAAGAAVLSYRAAAIASNLGHDMSDLARRMVDLERRVANLARHNDRLPQQSAQYIPVTPIRNDSQTSAQYQRSAGGQADGVISKSYQNEGPPMASTRGQIESKLQRYGPFFKARGLTEAQSNEIITLLIEKDNARRDMQQLIRDQGIDASTKAVDELRRHVSAPVTQKLREILGEEGYKAFGQYEMESFFRTSVVDPIASKLAAADAPLTELQLAKLLEVVMANTRQERRSPTDTSMQSRVDWKSVIRDFSKIAGSAQQQALLQAVESGKIPQK